MEELLLALLSTVLPFLGTGECAVAVVVSPGEVLLGAISPSGIGALHVVFGEAGVMLSLKCNSGCKESHTFLQGRVPKCNLGCNTGSPEKAFLRLPAIRPISPLSLLPQSRKESLSAGHRWEGR